MSGFKVAAFQAGKIGFHQASYVRWIKSEHPLGNGSF